jgi:hypothetical protein
LPMVFQNCSLVFFFYYINRKSHYLVRFVQKKNHSDQKSFWLKLSIQPATQREKKSKSESRSHVADDDRLDQNWEKYYKRQHGFNRTIRTESKEGSQNWMIDWREGYII